MSCLSYQSEHFHPTTRRFLASSFALPREGRINTVSPHAALRESPFCQKSTENSSEIDNWRSKLLKGLWPFHSFIGMDFVLNISEIWQLSNRKVLQGCKEKSFVALMENIFDVLYVCNKIVAMWMIVLIMDVHLPAMVKVLGSSSCFMAFLSNMHSRCSYC